MKIKNARKDLIFKNNDRFFLKSKSPFAPKHYKDLYPQGFKIYTFNAGFKKKNDDLLIIVFDNIVNVASKYSLTAMPSAPIIWDKKNNTIVSNESSEIIRMFNSEFDKIGAIPGNYYPKELRSEIDTINLRIYNTVNNGVYKTGFATSQEAYEEAIIPLFDTLNWIENKLYKIQVLLLHLQLIQNIVGNHLIFRLIKLHLTIL